MRNVFALASALEGRGWTVTIARDGLEAVENDAKRDFKNK